MPILRAEPQTFPNNLLNDLCAQRPVASLDVDCQAQAPHDRYAIRRWWVVRTKPRQEKSLARDLIVRDVPYYLPQVPQTALLRGRRQTSYNPLFPGYLFLFGTDNERSVSMTTNRIASFLTVADDNEFTHDLQQIWQLIESKSPLTVEGRLKTGDRVRVKKGTLAGVEGTVIDRRGRCRLLVAVHLLQQGVSMEIDDYMLEPI